jgi:predicted RNase H-like nuclease (RuvC/YqgF family)
MREILDKELGNGSHPDPAPSPASKRSAGGSKNKFTSLGLKPLVEFVADHLDKNSADVHEIAKRAGYDTTRSSVEQAIGRARGLKRQAAVMQTSPTVDRQREASGVSPVQQIGTIVAQLNVLGKQIEQLQSLNSDLEARNGELDARNADLKEQNARLQREAADLPKMREEIARLKKEAAEVPVLRRQLEKATALGQQLANLKT